MFIFYDTEATGLEMKFDQILQIALAFTDDNMNTLASKKLQSRRAPWVLPSAGAMLITGFTPDDLKNAPLSHFEMMQQTFEWIQAQHWPVLFAGFNTLGFDEEILARNLQQNLLDAEVTTALVGVGQHNGRFDLSEVVKAVESYMPGTLKLDRLNEKGYPSLSLKNIAQQNGIPLNDNEAHDAMNDVRATIGLAKLLKKAAPEIWDQMIKMATSEGVDQFVSKNQMFTHCYMTYGKAKGAVVTPLTTPADHQNTLVLFDLSYDPSRYRTMSVDELKKVVIEQKRKVEKGEMPPPRPFRIIDKTKQPTLMPIDYSDAVIPGFLKEKVARQRMQDVQADQAFQQRLRQAIAEAEMETSPPVNSQAPEFLPLQIGSADLKKRILDWAKEFKQAPDAVSKMSLVDAFKTRFADDLVKDPTLYRFPKFAIRIVYDIDPQALPEEKRLLMKQYIAERFFNTDPKAPYCTLAKARNELAEIENKRRHGDERWQNVTDGQIRALKLYYTAIEKEYAPYLASHPVNDNAQPDNSFKNIVPKPPAA